MSVKAILAEQQKSYTKAEEEALLATKQNTLTFDTTPTAGSTNPATSGGIATALDGRLPQPENAGAVGQVLTRTATGSIWQTQSSGGDIVAAASNSYAVTLYAASWSSQQQTIATPTGAEITSTSDGVLGLSPNATAAQVEAFQLAKIVVISQSASGVVVKALGTVPTINLPCELMLFMKADYYNKDYIDTYMAPLDTPIFIGTPKAPTAAEGTNTTQIATTAFVEQAKNTRVPVYGMGKNLLDNAYFLRPVNQRGQSSYSGAVYGIDRWKNNNGSSSVALSSDGLTLTASIQYASFLQRVSTEIPAGTQCTITVLYGSGSIQSNTFAWPSSGNYYITAIGSTGFYLTTNSTTVLAIARSTNGSASIILKAIKLELGTEQTLAHRENNAWVLNEIPDYEEELTKCQRYLFPVFKGSNDFGIYPNTVRSQVINGAPQGYARIQIIKPDMNRNMTPTIVNTFSSFRLVITKLSDSSTAAVPTLTVDSTVLAGNPSMWISFITSSNITSYLNGDYGFEVDTFGNNGYLFISTEP